MKGAGHGRPAHESVISVRERNRIPPRLTPARTAGGREEARHGLSGGRERQLGAWLASPCMRGQKQASLRTLDDNRTRIRRFQGWGRHQECRATQSLYHERSRISIAGWAADPLRARTPHPRMAFGSKSHSTNRASLYHPPVRSRAISRPPRGPPCPGTRPASPPPDCRPSPRPPAPRPHCPPSWRSNGATAGAVTAAAKGTARQAARGHRGGVGTAAEGEVRHRPGGGAGGGTVAARRALPGRRERRPGESGEGDARPGGGGNRPHPGDGVRPAAGAGGASRQEGGKVPRKGACHGGAHYCRRAGGTGRVRRRVLAGAGWWLALRRQQRRPHRAGSRGQQEVTEGEGDAYCPESKPALAVESTRG